MEINNLINKKKEHIIKTLVNYYLGELTEQKINDSWGTISHQCKVLGINFHELNKNDLHYLRFFKHKFYENYDNIITQYQLRKKYENLKRRGKLEKANEVLQNLNQETQEYIKNNITFREFILTD